MRSLQHWVIVGVIGLAGCQANAPAQTQSTIAGTEVALTASEKLARSYVTLPLCRPGASTVCSNAMTSAKIKEADNAAFAAVEAARASNSEADVAAANAAVAALVALVPSSAVVNN